MKRIIIIIVLIILQGKLVLSGFYTSGNSESPFFVYKQLNTKATNEFTVAYYVLPNGNDANASTSPTLQFKTIATG